MGLISRVSSRTYRRRKIYIMPDQAVANNSRSASYAKKVLYKRKRWTTSGEKKAAEKKLVKSDELNDSTQLTKNDDDSRPLVPVNLTEPPKIEGRYRSRLRFDLGRRMTPRQKSCLLEAIRK